MNKAIVAIDIGGANLKMAHSDGLIISAPFPLWKNPNLLSEKLSDLIARGSAADTLAITMTGELCDCFGSKKEGVGFLLDAVEEVSQALEVLVWQVEGQFTKLHEARQSYMKTAASNWAAIATFASSFLTQSPALLIDIGSTTTDIVPLLNGKCAARGWTDLERLKFQELVYTGVSRTPVCAMLDRIILDGVCIAPAAEFFATAKDVYTMLGHIPEDENDQDTADGRPGTVAFASRRLARMVCADMEILGKATVRGIADQVHAAQKNTISHAIETVCRSMETPPVSAVVCGSGEFLAREVLMKCDFRGEVISFSEVLGESASRAAAAYSLVRLFQNGSCI